MMFLTLEDLAGMLDVVLFPDVYRRAREVDPLLRAAAGHRDGRDGSSAAGNRCCGRRKWSR